MRSSHYRAEGGTRLPAKAVRNRKLGKVLHRIRLDRREWSVPVSQVESRMGRVAGMLETRTASRLADLWDDAKAAPMSEAARLLYRSNLLGSDKRITNYGGGNTSAKVVEKDPLTGDRVEVLWVKGSGGDVGTIKLDGFATLYLDKLEALKKL
jgi:hypothetical protein